MEGNHRETRGNDKGRGEAAQEVHLVRDSGRKQTACVDGQSIDKMKEKSQRINEKRLKDKSFDPPLPARKKNAENLYLKPGKRSNTQTMGEGFQEKKVYY